MVILIVVIIYLIISLISYKMMHFGYDKFIALGGAEMFWFIGMLVYSLIIGLIAKAIHPGEEKWAAGLIGSVTIGFLGTILGNWLSTILFHGSGSFLMSLVGGVLLIVIYEALEEPSNESK